MDAINTLQRLERGYFIEELVEQIADVSEAVRRAGKGAKGKVSCNLEIINVAGDIGIVINVRTAPSYPAKPARGMQFFVFDGELHTHDPRETELPAFRTVEPPLPASVRTPVEGEAVREAAN